METEPKGLRRRSFLRRALVALAAGGGAFAIHQNVGYTLPGSLDLDVLTTKEGAVLAAAAKRMLRSGPEEVSEDVLADVVSWVDGYLRRQTPWTRREVKALLQGIEHGPPVLTFQFSRFTRLSGEGQDRVLRTWSTHRVPLCRQGYLGLKGLVFMAAYRRPDFLRSIGYDGPPVS